MTSRKTHINVALKVAIVESRQKSQAVAFRARMTPDRLSKIANGHIVPTEQERRRIARALARHVDELFPEVAA